MVTLFPNTSLIENKGFDGSGNHKSKSDLFNKKFYKKSISTFPLKVEILQINTKKVEMFFKKNLTFIAKIKKRIYAKFF